MNVFAFSSILVVISNIAIAILVFLKGKDRKLKTTWAGFCLIAAFWGLGAYRFSTTTSKETAFFWWQISYIAVIIAPVLFSQFVFTYLKLNRKRLLTFSYIIAGIFLMFTFFTRRLFLGDLTFKFNEFFYVDWTIYKSPIWIIFYLGFYWLLLLYTFSELMKHCLNSSGKRHQQMKYFLVGTSIGWLGPHGQYLAYFGINVYPYSNFFIAFYPLIIGYAIIRHQLMDIQLVIKRSLVYSLLITAISIIFLVSVLISERLFQGFFGYKTRVGSILAAIFIALAFTPLKKQNSNYY